MHTGTHAHQGSREQRNSLPTDWDERDEVEDRSARRRRVPILGALVLLAVGALVGALAVVGFPAAGKHPVAVPKAVSHAAEQLQSAVATSARAIIPLGERLVSVAKQRGAYPHIVAERGATVYAKPIHFVFDGFKYTITPHVTNGVYWGAKRSTRLLVQLPGESDEAWTSAYYHAFADDPAQRTRNRRHLCTAACDQGEVASRPGPVSRADRQVRPVDPVRLGGLRVRHRQAAVPGRDTRGRHGFVRRQVGAAR